MHLDGTERLLATRLGVFNSRKASERKRPKTVLATSALVLHRNLVAHVVHTASVGRVLRRRVVLRRSARAHLHRVGHFEGSNKRHGAARAGTRPAVDHVGCWRRRVFAFELRRRWRRVKLAHLAGRGRLRGRRQLVVVGGRAGRGGETLGGAGGGRAMILSVRRGRPVPHVLITGGTVRRIRPRRRVLPRVHATLWRAGQLSNIVGCGACPVVKGELAGRLPHEFSLGQETTLRTHVANGGGAVGRHHRRPVVNARLEVLVVLRGRLGHLRGLLLHVQVLRRRVTEGRILAAHPDEVWAARLGGSAGVGPAHTQSKRRHH